VSLASISELSLDLESLNASPLIRQGSLTIMISSFLYRFSVHTKEKTGRFDNPYQRVAVLCGFCIDLTQTSPFSLAFGRFESLKTSYETRQIRISDEPNLVS